MKKGKKLTALISALMMGLAVLPVNVIAEEDIQEEKTEETVQEETAEPAEEETEITAETEQEAEQVQEETDLNAVEETVEETEETSLTEPEEEEVREELAEEAVSEETAEGEPVYNDLVQYELWLGPVQVSSENKDNILGSDTSRASFDPETSTLTLYGTFTDTNSVQVGIWAEKMDLKIEGDAEINVAHISGSKGISVYSGSLTISGDIRIIADHCGINAYNSNLVFDSGEITVKANAGDAIAVQNGQAEIHDNVDRLEADGSTVALTADKLIFKDEAFRILKPENAHRTSSGLISTPSYESPKVIEMTSANHFTVSYNPGDGSGSMKKDRVFTGEKYYLPECTFTAPEEMKFAGWLGEDGKTYAEKEEKDITADCTFTAQWIPKYDLTVGGVKVTKENKNNIFGDGKASYDSDTNVLTLNGTFDYREKDLDCFIKASKMDLTIAGNSEILISNSSQKAIGIQVLNGSVWVDGDLTISANMYGIYSDKALTLAKGKIKITANHNGYALTSFAGNLTVDDGITSLEAEGTASAMYSSTKIVLGDNVIIGTPENGKISDNEKEIVDENGIGAKKVVIYKNKSYEVKYDANGAGGTMAADVLYEGQDYSLPECTFEIPEDMVFAGWMDEYGRIFKEKDPYEIHKDTVFTARWALKYDLDVGGVHVDASNKKDIFKDGGSAVFNSETNTLTLNKTVNPEDMPGASAVYAYIEARNMNLRLEGKAAITLDEDSSQFGTVLVTAGTLTLAGDFELTGKVNAVKAEGITIEKGSVYAEAIEEAGVAVDAGEGSLTIGDDVERVEATCGEKPFNSWKEYNISKELILQSPENGTIEYGRAYDENGKEVKEVLLVKRTKPYFSGHQLVLTGSLGLRFRMSFPKGMSYEDGSMSFFVNGIEQIQPTPLIDDGKTYYTCYLTSLQMAETIEAVYTYGDNQTVSQTYSLEKYFNYFDEHPGEFDAATLKLIQAVANYGYYAQPYLVNLHNLGDKYAKITKNYPVTFDYQATLAETEKYAFSKSFGNSKVEAAAYKLSLDTDTILSIRIKVPAGTQLSAAAVFAGDSYGAHSEDGTTYIIEIPSIKATRLDEMITVFGYTNDDDQNEKFSISVCPLSYVRSILKSNKSDEAKNTVCALYEYYKAVKKY